MIKTELQSNNLDLRALLDAINNLPNKGSGTGEDISEELTAQDALISEISLALDEVAVAQAEAFAAIGVTYPEGSTCTCSNGTKTLTAKDTSGQALFLIPEAGNWTVTSTDGTNSKSQTVEITTESQFESVILSYALMLFDNGEVVDWTSRSAKPTASVGETLYVYVNTEDNHSTITTAETLNVSEYNTLHFIIDAIEGAKNDRHFIGLSTNTTPMNGMGTVNSSAVAYITSVKTGENVIDISDVTNGSYYVCIAQGGTESNPRGMRASKVWLV